MATDSSTQPLAGRSAVVPGYLRTTLAPLALSLLALALIGLGGAFGRPGTNLAVDDPGAGRALIRLYGLESNETDRYRWSEPLFGVFLYGYEGRPALATLRLIAPRPANSAPVELRATAAGVDLGSFTVAGSWRRYRILAPTSPAGESVLLLQTAPFVPEGDPRELGVAVSRVTLVATTHSAGVPPIRALFLLSLPLLGWLALWRLGTPAWAALAAGGLLALIGGLAAAFPTPAGYWLPTLGWPWWPLLPLLLLTTWPQIAGTLVTARARLDERLALGWAALGAALVAVIGMRLGLPWPLGMALLVAGAWAASSLLPRSAAVEVQAESWARRVPLLLLTVIAAALFLRFVNLDGQPAGLWRDESRHGLQALRIWSDPNYRPIYVVEGADLPALLFYLMAPILGTLGPHPWSVRLVSALAGALTPLALYWAGAPLVGRRAALIGAALLAWASWSLSMSRWAFPATLDHLLTLAAAGLVWRCVGGRGWRPVAAMALAGLLGGLAVYAYHTGRVAPLALAAVAAIRLGWDRSAWRRALPGLAAAAVVGTLTVAPLAAFILGDLDGYNRRVGSVSILDSNDPTTHTPAGLLLGNLGRYGLMFHVQGDSNGRHHMPGAPMLDPLAGLALALGVALALRRLVARAFVDRTARGEANATTAGLAAVLAFGAVYLIPGVFSGNAPHAMRSLGTLAPALLLAGVGLASLAWPTGLRPRSALLAVALAASLAFNGWLYFGAMRVAPAVYGEFDLLETALGRAAAAPAASADPALRAVRVYLPERLRGADTVRFLTWGVQINGFSGAALASDGPALIVLPGDATAGQQAEALAALGPQAQPLGPLSHFPGTNRPVALAFGRGAAAEQLFAEIRR